MKLYTGLPVSVGQGVDTARGVIDASQQRGVAVDGDTAIVEAAHDAGVQRLNLLGAQDSLRYCFDVW